MIYFLLCSLDACVSVCKVNRNSNFDKDRGGLNWYTYVIPVCHVKITTLDLRVQGGERCVRGEGTRVVRVGAARARGSNARSQGRPHNGQAVQGLQGVRSHRESVSSWSVYRETTSSRFEGPQRPQKVGLIGNAAYLSYAWYIVEEVVSICCCCHDAGPCVTTLLKATSEHGQRLPHWDVDTQTTSP